MEEIGNKAPVIGFVRYSQKIRYGKSEKERDVFEAKYFEYRIDIFKKITLKSFQQQTNKNFILLLLHSETMPSQYKKRFIELEKTNPFLHNVFLKDTLASLKEVLNNCADYLSFENDVAITFRIDNDDAVQNNYIQSLYGFLKIGYVGFAISMPGLCVVKRISKASFMVEERFFPSNSIGLAYVTNREHYKTVLELGSHIDINRDTQMILLPGRTSGGLMTINGENEANSINNSKVEVLNFGDLEKYLKERKIEDLNLNCLRIFPQTNILTKLPLKKPLKLLVPPIFITLLKKMTKFR